MAGPAQPVRVPLLGLAGQVVLAEPGLFRALRERARRTRVVVAAAAERAISRKRHRVVLVRREVAAAVEQMLRITRQIAPLVPLVETPLPTLEVAAVVAATATP